MLFSKTENLINSNIKKHQKDKLSCEKHIFVSSLTQNPEGLTLFFKNRVIKIKWRLHSDKMPNKGHTITAGLTVTDE